MFLDKDETLDIAFSRTVKVEELLDSEEVHCYTKDYFSGEQ